jgi:hypothetical protein
VGDLVAQVRAPRPGEQPGQEERPGLIEGGVLELVEQEVQAGVAAGGVRGFGAVDAFVEFVQRGARGGLEFRGGQVDARLDVVMPEVPKGLGQAADRDGVAGRRG